MLLKPLKKRVPADAPGHDATGSCLVHVTAGVFGPLFTGPSFRTFSMLACGFLAHTGKRTVCGMLTGAGLSRVWGHHRAHYFFARARWEPGDLGLAVARLVVSLLVPAGEPVVIAIDDTLFRRRGKKVWAASWFHDGSVQGPHKTGCGNNWVIAAIVVNLPFFSRPVALPVLAKLVVKGTTSASRLWLARRMAAGLAGALPGCAIRVVADAAYAGRELKKLAPGDHLDHPAAQGRRPARPAAAAHRQARPSPRPREPAPVPGRARCDRGVHPGHRHPLRHDRHRAGRRPDLPVVLRIRLPPVQLMLVRDRPPPAMTWPWSPPTCGDRRAVIERYASRWSSRSR